MTIYEHKSIYCPQCKNEIGTWDGKTRTDQIRCCRKCKKMIVFTPATRKAKIQPLPERTASSGMTFY